MLLGAFEVVRSVTSSVHSTVHLLFRGKKTNFLITKTYST